MIEVRCEGNRLLFKVDEAGRIEYRCRRCASAIRKARGLQVVVLHRVTPGDWRVETRVFRDPVARRPAQVTAGDLVSAYRLIRPEGEKEEMMDVKRRHERTQEPQAAGLGGDTTSLA